MNDSIQTIPLTHLAIAFIPVAIVLLLLYRWALKPGKALYAILRMLTQLLLIGYVLAYIFDAKHPAIVLGVLMVMIAASSWIALGSVKEQRTKLYAKVLLCTAIGGGTSLLFITQGVLRLDPWFHPQFMVPLAGMIFANPMNSISLAAERLYAEVERDVPYLEARKIAFQAALIPTINTLFAVGIVSIPGMMTARSCPESPRSSRCATKLWSCAWCSDPPESLPPAF